MLTYDDYPEVVVVDLVAARESLGLPADAVPGANAPDNTDEAEQQSWDEFDNAAWAVPFLHGVDPRGFGRAIDGRQISAAANTTLGSGFGALSVFRTSQDFDSIARRLQDVGFARQGNLLTYEGQLPNPSRVYFVAGANGLVALSSDRHPRAARRVQEAVSEPAPARTELGGLLARIHTETGAPGLMLIESFDEASTEECAETVIGAETFGGGQDELILVDPADPDAVVLDDLGTPARDGDLLRVPVDARLTVYNAFYGPFELMTRGESPWRCGLTIANLSG